MNTKSISNAATVSGNGYQIIFSYGTPVFYRNTKTGDVVLNRYSVTTSKHIGNLTGMAAAEWIKNGAREVSIEEIKTLTENL